MALELKDTLLLPKTDFPMRANLVQREPARITHWEKLGLYAAIQKKRAGAPTFVLHDGPPFTNGDVHIGTALNKTLKDIINRYKSMRGFRTPYVPGWDCHGLPIEQKVTRELQTKKQQVTTSELRARCDAFSESWIAKQTAQFKRLGVLADWANQYKTKSPAFEADVLRTFAAFIEKGLIYRAKKPVYYSIPFETALAEAEIEYQDHVSPSIWVKFPVPAAEATRFDLPTDKPLFIVIWTTTPWTLPANLAIALHPLTLYALVKTDRECLFVAESLVGQFTQHVGIKDYNVVIAHPGSAYQGLQARHPFIERASPVVLANYVTTDSGTGCVHTAPGHGPDDYLTGREYNLPIFCPIDGKGRYAPDPDYPKLDYPELDLPSALLGKSTFESVEDLTKKRTSEANLAVLRILESTNTLVCPPQRHVHQYPHCWRSKTPVIYCAQYQWFVSLDKSGMRQAALAEIDEISKNGGWIPAWGEARIRGAVESRPDWCISRNRRWGVPIPVFYHNNIPLVPNANDSSALDEVARVVRAIADKVEVEGSRFWEDWFIEKDGDGNERNKTSERILSEIPLPSFWPKRPLKEFTHCQDTFDVWIDSGSTHAATLRRGLGHTTWPADLYLEGSDQHRGWFQSSLWCGVIAFGGAPYKTVLTHGFIVDQERNKISKSSTYEKPQTSDSYIADYGADVIRLWISSQDFRNDIPISKEILSHVGETYRLIRNTFRFQLSNLFDFDPAQHAMAVEKMDALDRWALHQTVQLLRLCTAAYDSYEFHRVYQLCNQFCSVTLSATYHDILKDRLYTLGTAHPLRRSSQTAIHRIFTTLVKVLAPIVSFTTDEAWSFGTARTEYAQDSIHLQDWPEAPAEWTDAALAAEFAALLKVRAAVNENLEPLRQAGAIGKGLEAAVVVTGAPDDAVFRGLERYRDFLAELFIVSHVTLAPQSGAPLSIAARHARELGLVRCPRCWRWVPTLTSSPHGEVCPRCQEALNS